MRRANIVGLLAASILMVTDPSAALIQQTGVASSDTVTIGANAIVRSVSTAAGQTTITTGNLLNPVLLSTLTDPFLVGPGSVFNPFLLTGASTPLAVTGGTVFNPFPVAGAAVPVVTTGSIFDPFPFAGASAPLVGLGETIFDPFPFAGARAPLISGISPIGAGAAPFFEENVVIGGPAAAAGFPVVTLTRGRETLVPRVESVVNVNGGLTAEQTVTLTSLSGSNGQNTTLIQNPEPASMLLLATGLIALVAALRRQRGTETDPSRCAAVTEDA